MENYEKEKTIIEYQLHQFIFQKYFNNKST